MKLVKEFLLRSDPNPERGTVRWRYRQLNGLGKGSVLDQNSPQSGDDLEAEGANITHLQK